MIASHLVLMCSHSSCSSELPSCWPGLLLLGRAVPVSVAACGSDHQPSLVVGVAESRASAAMSNLQSQHTYFVHNHYKYDYINFLTYFKTNNLKQSEENIFGA